jgi:hypothetical protein
MTFMTRIDASGVYLKLSTLRRIDSVFLHHRKIHIPPFSRRDASEYQNFHFLLFSVFTQLSYMSIKGILAECGCLYVYTGVVKMFLSHKSYIPAFS